MDLKMMQNLHEQYEALKVSMKSDKLASETSWEVSAAKTIINDMISKIAECIQKLNRNDNLYYRLLAMEGALYYQHAKILVQFNEMERAQEILKTCTEFLKDSFLVPEVTFLGLRVLNHYCYLLTKCGDLEKSQNLLELAEKKYIELIKNGEPNARHAMYSNDDLFQAKLEMIPNSDITEKLERLVTNNLQMLGYVYNKQGNLEKFAKYHHRVLRRQLDMREGDATVWAMKTARLGYFFLTRNKFSQARHHLAAACYVLSQYENTLKTLEMTDLVLAKWEELNHRYADIAKCWVKYGLFLFNASKMKFVSTFYGEPNPLLENLWNNPLESFVYGCSKSDSTKDNNLWSVSQTSRRDELIINYMAQKNVESFTPNGGSEVAKESLNSSKGLDVIFENLCSASSSSRTGRNDSLSTNSISDGTEKKVDQKSSGETLDHDFIFPNLDLSCFENCVSCNYVDSLQAAKCLFLFTHSWLKKSKLFYTLKDHPMEYVNVVLDLSELYRYLAFYEDDVENQYSIQKRRADTLETLNAVLKEARPQCYLSLSIDLLRELAEVHLELMGLNLRRLYLAQPEAVNASNGKTPSQIISDFSDHTAHKMEAVADIHQRLYQFSDSFRHGAYGDFVSSTGASDVTSNNYYQNLFDSYQNGEVKPF